MSLVASREVRHPNTKALSGVTRNDKDINKATFEQYNSRQALPFLPNQTREIEIDASNALLDNHSMHLEFKVEAETSKTYYEEGSGHSYLQRVTVVNQNGAVLADLDQYNLWYHMQAFPSVGRRFCNKNWHQGLDNLAPEELSLPVVALNKGRASTVAGVTYMIPLNLDLFKHHRYLHLPVLGRIKVKFTFAPIAEVAQSAVGATIPTTYSITNAVLHARMLEISPSFIDFLEKQSAAGDLIYNPHNVVWQTISVGVNDSNTLTLDGNLQSCEKAFVVRRSGLDITGAIPASAATAKHQLTKYAAPGDGFDHMQWRHGIQRYPTTTITNHEQSYMFLEEAMGLTGNADCESLISRENYTDVSVQAATVTLEKTQKFINGMEFSRAGRNTGISLAQNSLQFTESISGTRIAANSDLKMAVVYSSALQVLPNNQVLVGV